MRRTVQPFVHKDVIFETFVSFIGGSVQCVRNITQIDINGIGSDLGNYFFRFYDFSKIMHLFLTKIVSLIIGSYINIQRRKQKRISGAKLTIPFTLRELW